MKSVWNDADKKNYKELDGDIKTDVLVVGGGMCGLLCAYMLKNAGVDCVLVEKDRICTGVTNATTAKITFQHGLIYGKITEKSGVGEARMYYESQKSAFDRLTGIARKINCDFEVCDSFVYSLNDGNVIEKEVEALNRIGCNAVFCKDTELPFDVAGAVKVEKQAKFHPLKFAYNIAENSDIYENTKILDIKSGLAITDKGRITAEKIIVATHFPFMNRHGEYFLKMYQNRSYVLALKNAQNVSGIYVDGADGGLSFRSYGDRLLLGGGGHRTGKQGGGWRELSLFAEKYYPDAEETGRWATQDCMTLDGLPYIGNYSALTPDLYAATGFNKWGMTSSMLSAMILTDMVCGRKNEYERMYSPSRSMIHPQLAVNMIESVKGLITLKKPRCTHLGCALKYNKEEHSWDCSCHGSRFDENGKLLNNPAKKDLKQ